MEIEIFRGYKDEIKDLMESYDLETGDRKKVIFQLMCTRAKEFSEKSQYWKNKNGIV